MSTSIRRLASHASWIAPLIAVAVLLSWQDRAASPDDLGPFLRAGVWLVVLASAGLIAGIVGMLLSLRPARPSALIPLVGITANALLLWYFAPYILGLYF
jgi:hypothetical protein